MWAWRSLCTGCRAKCVGAGLRCDSGGVGTHCVLAVAESRPKSFVFGSTHTAGFISIMGAVASTVGEKTLACVCVLTFLAMNTKDVGGLPQDRGRTYTVGSFTPTMRRHLQWPSGCPTVPLNCNLEGGVVDPPQLPNVNTSQHPQLQT